MADKKMTYEELLLANPEELSDDDLGRRIKLTELKKSEREVELVESQNSKFQDEKVEKARWAEAKSIIIADTNAKLDNEKSICRHKTGGKNLPGFFNGDGKQGYSVATQQLPTQEVYYLCMRCQKEWRLPNKRDVLDVYNKVGIWKHKGGIDAALRELAKYRAQEAEYFKVAAWDKPLFETDSGVIPGSVLFRIPRLEEQRAKDDAEFAKFLREIEAEPVAR